jgi:hypothetical protein
MRTNGLRPLVTFQFLVGQSNIAMVLELLTTWVGEASGEIRCPGRIAVRWLRAGSLAPKTRPTKLPAIDGRELRFAHVSFGDGVTPGSTGKSDGK